MDHRAVDHGRVHSSEREARFLIFYEVPGCLFRIGLAC